MRPALRIRRDERNRRYYNGVDSRWTTTCCRSSGVIALLAAWSLTTAAQSGSRSVAAPLALFPVRTQWTLSLGRQLAIPPAYEGSRAYLALVGDQLVAYNLSSGAQ